MFSCLTLNPTVKRVFLVKFCLLGSILPLNSLAQEAYWHYKFKKGDNLINVAKKHLYDEHQWKLIQKINGIRNPYTLPVGFPIRVPLSLVKLQETSATLILLQGDVQVSKSDIKTNTFELAKNLMKLSLGDVIKTGERSLAVIQFVDGSLLNLESNSVLVLENLKAYSGSLQSNTIVKLKQGRAKVHANPQHLEGQPLKIMTPNAIAAVRGTVFKVSTDEHMHVTTQETLAGRVALSNPISAVEVSQGEGSAAIGDSPPLTPVPLLQAIDTTMLSQYWEKLPALFAFPTQKESVAWHVKVMNAESKIEEDIIIKEPRYAINHLHDGKYQLKVSALDKNHIEGYEATHPFEVAANPLPPKLMLPEHQSTVRNSSLLLQWQQPKLTQRLHLQLAKDAGFKQIMDSQFISGNQFEVSLKQAGEYYWRVASVEDKQGPYSKVYSFKYVPLPIAPELQDFKIETLGNRVFVSYVGESTSHDLHLRLKHPQFPQILESQSITAKNVLNTHKPIMLELREYGKQQLLLSWQVDNQTRSAQTIFEFTASNPFTR